MRLREIEIEGFRGIKDRLQLIFPAGFAVITGPNGSGKSTICDAIEFALTGTILRFKGVHEANESIDDYIWWREGTLRKTGRVRLTFIDDSGNTRYIERMGEKLSHPSHTELRDLLLRRPVALDDLPYHLAITTILRAETVAQTGLELSERDKFDLVRSALGTADISAIQRTLQAAVSLLALEVKNHEEEYQRLRQTKLTYEAQLSGARSDAAKATTQGDMTERLRALIPNIRGGDLATLSKTAADHLATLHQQINELTRLLGNLQALDGDLSFKAAQAKKIVANLEPQNAALQKRLVELRASLVSADKELQGARSRAQSAGAMRELIDLGERISLQHGQCPLCGLSIDLKNFRDHIEHVRSELKQGTEGVSNALRKRDAIATDIAKDEQTFQTLVMQLNAAKRDIAVFEALTGETASRLADYGIKGLEDKRSSIDAVTTLKATLEKSATEIQTALGAVESSKSIARVLELEKTLQNVQANINSIERALTSIHRASTLAKENFDIVRRVAGEVVDDRLAALSPLLQEIYERLKPHSTWRELDYRLRGDVQRSLSLRVGDGLNPVFTFSSGQRRALGVGFLLAINLARPWSALDSVILDDPVQHIDDFRALHLAELLSAVRQTNRQVVCALENRDLAELMCRRLRSSSTSEGILIELAYDQNKGVVIAKSRAVRPPPVHALLAA